jgi:hypothetical protein
VLRCSRTDTDRRYVGAERLHDTEAASDGGARMCSRRKVTVNCELWSPPPRAPLAVEEARSGGSVDVCRKGREILRNSRGFDNHPPHRRSGERTTPASGETTL